MPGQMLGNCCSDDQQDPGIPTARGWPAGWCPTCVIARTGLGNKIETALRVAASHRDGSGVPLAHACDGKAAMDDVQDRARLAWGPVDHPAGRVCEVRAPPGDRAPTG